MFEVSGAKRRQGAESRKGCWERDADDVPAQHEATRSALSALRRSSFPHRFPFHLDEVRVMNQPVQNAFGQRGGADLFMPSADRQL